MVNRGALIVRPAQPYLDWASGLDDSGIVPDSDGEQTVYLIPSFEDDVEAQKILKRIFPEVFERELFAWHTDSAAWPQRRTFAIFKQWFKVELHSIVEDLCAGELVDEDEF